MTNISNRKFGTSFTAILCTVLFSATCVLSAVGPAKAAEAQGAARTVPTERVYA